MIFRKYNEIENTYRTDFIQKIKNLNLDPNTPFACFNKIDGCLEGNTILDTLEFGNKTIKEIVEKNLQVHIKCYDHKTNEIIFCSILNRSKTTSKNNWYKILTEDGKEIFITGNHKVFLPKLNCYRAVEELTCDDEFLVC